MFINLTKFIIKKIAIKMKILLSWFLIIGTILNLVNTLEAKSASKKKRDSLKNGIQSTRKADDDRCKEFFWMEKFYTECK